MDDDDVDLRTPDEAQEDARRKYEALIATLAHIPERRFLTAVWAVRGVQSDYAESAKNRLVELPPEAITKEFATDHSIHPWELETLINERLSIKISALFQTHAPERWPQIVALVNLVRSIENDEYLVFNDPDDVLDHIFSIGNRQFAWQQGFGTKQQIFRNIFVYGQGKCASRFCEKNEITINEFTKACFVFYAQLQSRPDIIRNTDLTSVDISSHCREATLQIISRHISKLKIIAGERRGHVGEMAYKPSVLRQFPLIGVTARSHRLVAPLPELLLERMTVGLFYDVIDGGGAIREEIGKRFEEYVKMILSYFLPEVTVSRETKYMTKRGQVKSPDLLLSFERDAIDVVLECKALRLPVTSRFGVFDKEDRGYRDMIKGVKQIWRYILDTRLNRTGAELSHSIIGALVTLDSWFVAAPTRQEKVLATARDEFTRENDDWQEDDLIDISFVYIPELERLLAFGDSKVVLNTFRRTADDRKRGFSFDKAQEEGELKEENFQKFPFDEMLQNLLPWWEQVITAR